MKKCFVILIFVLFINLTLSSCKSFFEGDDKLANRKMEEILNVIQPGKEKELKALFSADIAMNLNEGVEELMNYYKGSYQNFERVGGPNVSDSFSYGKGKKTINTSFLVSTNIEQYCVYFKWCIEDDFDKQNIGVRSLYIIRSLDNPHFQKFVYWGDGSGSEGIYVGKPYAGTYLEDLISCTYDQNQEQFISLFSQNAIAFQADFMDNVSTLFSMYDGKYDNIYKKSVTTFSSEHTKGYDISYLLYRLEERIPYVDCICLRWCTDSEDPNNLGALSFYFKKADSNISMEDFYWGDGNWLSGIHIDVQQNPS